MHEMSLCESLIGIIEETARRERFSQVRVVRLEIGRFAGVETAAMRFGFEAISPGTVAEGARLEIEEAPGAAWCFDCDRTVPLRDRLDPCPECGGTRLQPSGGTDIRIKDMEVL
jgi:hydrogenase nickel incorporation protein HypA/HybF